MAFHISKVANFGTSEPWVARLWLGMLRFRDIVYIGEANRSAFDEKFAPIINNLHECFLGMRLLRETIADHKASVLTKEVNQNVVSIESVDNKIHECFTNFFIKGNIAINNLCSLSKYMDCNIGFIRQLEDEKFEKSAKKLLEHVPAASNLMDMIRKDRSDWFLNFLRFRGEIEHESYQTPKVKYVLKTNELRPHFPQMDGMELVDFTKKVWQCLFTFIEDILIRLFSFKLPPQIAIKIVPVKERDPRAPIKYLPAFFVQPPA